MSILIFEFACLSKTIKLLFLTDTLCFVYTILRGNTEHMDMIQMCISFYWWVAIKGRYMNTQKTVRIRSDVSEIILIRLPGSKKTKAKNNTPFRGCPKKKCTYKPFRDP